MRNLFLLAAAVLSTLLSFVAHAANDAPVTVNAQPVEKAWLDIAKQDAQRAGRKLDDKAALSNLIRIELLSQEAVRLGIDKRQDFAARQEIRRNELLANLLIDDYLKQNPISEDMIKAEYERFKARLGNKEYKARHIQLKTEQEAREVIAQLSKGADFAKLAKEKSQDNFSKDKGGELGWVAKGALIPPLGDALSKLQKGLFNTVPLQTNEGWHVLKVEDVRELKAPPYDKVKERLRQSLRTQQINELVQGLSTKAKIEFAK
jgi:peptidyl-prolyl cis-trans isomerase C